MDGPSPLWRLHDAVGDRLHQTILVVVCRGISRERVLRRPRRRFVRRVQDGGGGRGDPLGADADVRETLRDVIRGVVNLVVG